MGAARGKWARLVTDRASDKPQKSQTHYYILFEFREELLAVARLPWKGCVQGDTGLDGECDEIFAGAVAAVVTAPNYLLCNSQACKVWACEYLSSLSEGSYSSPYPPASLSVGSFWFMEVGCLFFVDVGLVICRFLLVL